MRYFVVFLLMLVQFNKLYAQEEPVLLKGTVVDEFSQLPINNANVINLNSVKGSVTNELGKFEIEAQVNDTLHISFVGYQSIKVRVPADWIKVKDDFKIKIIEKANALDEIIIHKYQLTGVLEVDSKLIQLEENYRLNITGLNYGYEANDGSKLANSVLGGYANPADALFNTFSKKGKEMKKLRKVKDDENVRNSLATKYDREMVCALLNITKKDITDILQKCEYSKTFIDTATDLQIMDAIKSCYEDYRFLSK
nr:carboxypeptidase-like regulatory domain-containing protein [uncultured Flavobacterium sp.]